MKAIVLETRDGWAAVLREDGIFDQTEQPCQVGETIELAEPSEKRGFGVMGAVLARPEAEGRDVSADRPEEDVPRRGDTGPEDKDTVQSGLTPAQSGAEQGMASVQGEIARFVQEQTGQGENALSSRSTGGPDAPSFREGDGQAVPDSSDAASPWQGDGSEEPYDEEPRGLFSRIRAAFARVNGYDGEADEYDRAAADGPEGGFEEEDIQTEKRRRKRQWIQTAVAAVLALSIAGGTYGYNTAMAASYISLDVEDSSVEFSVNRMGRVIGVRALNGSEGSSALASALEADVKNQTVQDAVDTAVQVLREDGTLGKGVIVGVTAGEESKREELSGAVSAGLESAANDGDFPHQTVKASREKRDEAMRRRKSAGRYVFEELGMTLDTRDQGGPSWGIGIAAVPEPEPNIGDYISGITGGDTAGAAGEEKPSASTEDANAPIQRGTFAQEEPGAASTESRNSSSRTTENRTSSSRITENRSSSSRTTESQSGSSRTTSSSSKTTTSARTTEQRAASTESAASTSARDTGSTGAAGTESAASTEGGASTDSGASSDNGGRPDGPGTLPPADGAAGENPGGPSTDSGEGRISPEGGPGGPSTDGEEGRIPPEGGPGGPSTDGGEGQTPPDGTPPENGEDRTPPDGGAGGASTENGQGQTPPDNTPEEPSGNGGEGRTPPDNTPEEPTGNGGQDRTPPDNTPDEPSGNGGQGQTPPDNTPDEPTGNGGQGQTPPDNTPDESSGNSGQGQTPPDNTPDEPTGNSGQGRQSGGEQSEPPRENRENQQSPNEGLGTPSGGGTQGEPRQSGGEEGGGQDNGGQRETPPPDSGEGAGGSGESGPRESTPVQDFRGGPGNGNG